MIGRRSAVVRFMMLTSFPHRDDALGAASLILVDCFLHSPAFTLRCIQALKDWSPNNQHVVLAGSDHQFWSARKAANRRHQRGRGPNLQKLATFQRSLAGRYLAATLSSLALCMPPTYMPTRTHLEYQMSASNSPTSPFMFWLHHQYSRLMTVYLLLTLVNALETKLNRLYNRLRSAAWRGVVFLFFLDNSHHR